MTKPKPLRNPDWIADPTPQQIAAWNAAVAKHGRDYVYGYNAALELGHLPNLGLWRHGPNWLRGWADGLIARTS